MKWKDLKKSLVVSTNDPSKEIIQMNNKNNLFKIIEKLNECIKDINSYINSSDDIVDEKEPPIIICPPESEQPKPEPEKPKPGYQLFTPHHEMLSDIYLSNDKRNIFTESDLENQLKSTTNSKKYFIYYPGANDALDFTNRKINIEKISEQFELGVGKDFEGYGLLDYENDWFRSLDKGVGTKEHVLVTQIMIEAIRSLKKKYPKVKWSYYGIPKLPYWIPKSSPSYSWGNAPEQVKQETLAFYLNAYKDVLKECDFINVSLYNRYDPMVHPPNQPNLLTSEYEYRKNCAILANQIKKINNTNIPIFAMYHQTYAVGGHAQYVEKLIPNDFIAKSLLDPYMDGGVNGFMYWDALHYYAWTCFPTNASTSPNWIFANAFAKNFGFDYSKIPWKFGQAPEKERDAWRDKYVSLYSRKALELIQFVDKHVNE